MRKKLLMIMIISIVMFYGCEKKPDLAADNDIKLDDDNDIKRDNDDEKEVFIPSDLMLPKMDTSLVSDFMQDNAIMTDGNLSRLASVMQKAKNGENISIGVIGGSITQGSSATSIDKSYAYYVHKWWQEAFPEIEVGFTNAGIGATNSYLAVHRVDKDLLFYEPDVVIIEFSVNDYDSIFFRKTYEDLVRKILKAKNNPAVLLLFTTMEDGTSAQGQHLFVGFHYDLPRISYRQAILKEIEEDRLAWKDISPDNIHPNNTGHEIIAEIMWNFFNSIYLRIDTIDKEIELLDKEPLFQESYINASILDNNMIEPIQMGSFEKSDIHDRFKNNWSTNSGKESIIFEINTKNLGIMYYKETDGSGGQYEVYIDGEYNRTLDGDFTGGWGDYVETVEVLSSNESKTHTIEIKKSDTSSGDFFAIVGFLVS